MTPQEGRRAGGGDGIQQGGPHRGCFTGAGHHTDEGPARHQGRAGQSERLGRHRLETGKTTVIHLLLAKAADADSTPLEDSLTIQSEIVLPDVRQVQLLAARDVIEASGANGLLETVVLAAVSRTGHHRSAADLAKQDEPPPPGQVPRPRANDLPDLHQSRKNVIQQRQQTVEPVFGIIKSARGFRQFLPRGKEKESPEWSLVSLACNMRRLHI